MSQPVSLLPTEMTPSAVSIPASTNNAGTFDTAFADAMTSPSSRDNAGYATTTKADEQAAGSASPATHHPPTTSAGSNAADHFGKESAGQMADTSRQSTLAHVVSRSNGASSHGTTKHGSHALTKNSRKVQETGGSTGIEQSADPQSQQSSRASSAVETKAGSSQHSTRPQDSQQPKKVEFQAPSDAATRTHLQGQKREAEGAPKLGHSSAKSLKPAGSKVDPTVLHHTGVPLAMGQSPSNGVTTRTKRNAVYHTQVVSPHHVALRPTAEVVPRPAHNEANPVSVSERHIIRTKPPGVAGSSPMFVQDGLSRINPTAPPTGNVSVSMTPESNTQVFQTTVGLAADGGGSARITLHPESLGTVMVNLNISAHGVTNIHMTASTAEGYQALAATSGQLAQHLAHSGFTVGSLQTTMSNGSAMQPSSGQVPQSGTAFGGSGGAFAGTHQNPGGSQQQASQPHLPTESTTSLSSDKTDDTVKAYA